MKRLLTIPISFVVFFLLFSASTAQMKSSNNATLVVPEKSIAAFIKPLLPFQIDFGKNFSGSFYIQSIKNIAIKKDKILFSSHIVGNDVGYTAKIGKSKAKIELGNVNLHNQWTASFRYDKVKKKIMIKPHIEGSGDQKELSQGDLIVNALLEAFSDIEYPIEVEKLKPVTTEILNQRVVIRADIADIYTSGDKLFIEVAPKAQVEKPKGK